MNVCPKCKTVISDKNAQYCLECGAPVERKAGSNKLWIITGVVGSLVLIAGLLLLLRGFIGTGSRAAAMAPAETDMFFTINPNLEQVNNFKRIKDIYLEIPEVKRAIDDLKQELKDDFSLDFEADIKPWLGRELAVVVPYIESPNPFDDENAFLFAIATKDVKKTAACMEQLRRHEEEERSSYFSRKTYEGVEIYVEPDVSPPVVYAITKGFLLLSNDEGLVCSTIDRLKRKNKETLIKNEKYKEVLAKLPKSRAGMVYLDHDYLNRVVSSDGGGDAGKISQIEAANALGVSLSFVSEGIRVDYALDCDLEKLPQYEGETKRTSDTLQRLIEITPAGVLACTGSTGLKSILRDLAEHEDMEYFERDTGIYFEQDILSWMSGEGTVALLPDRDGLLGESDVPIGILAMIGTKDSQTARSALNKILDILQDEGGEVTSDTIGSFDVHYLVEPYKEEVIAGYGIRGNVVVIGSSENVLRQALEGRGEHLDNDAAFKKAGAGLSFPGDDCLYINVEKGVNWARNSLRGYQLEEFNRTVYPYLRPISTITMASHKPGEKDSFTTGALLINVK
ncbi:MAG: DUF3352 domain-containing protein [Bacillota bacterium]